MADLYPILAADAEPFNWNNLVLVILAFFAAWERYRAMQRDKEQAQDKLERAATKSVVENSAAVVKTVAENVETVVQKVEVIHKETNSMKDALVDATARASKSEGKEQERVEERERVAEDARAKPASPADPQPVIIANELSDPANVKIIKP